MVGCVNTVGSFSFAATFRGQLFTGTRAGNYDLLVLGPLVFSLLMAEIETYKRSFSQPLDRAVQ